MVSTPRCSLTGHGSILQMPMTCVSLANFANWAVTSVLMPHKVYTNTAAHVYLLEARIERLGDVMQVLSRTRM